MSVVFRVFLAAVAVSGNAAAYLWPVPDPAVNVVFHLFFGVIFGLVLGSFVGEFIARRWKKARSKICTSCGGLLKTYFLTAPDGKVRGSYKQCPRWVATWNIDPVNCHNPPNSKRSSVTSPWSPYFSAPMPLPPGVFCFVHGAQVNLSCGACLTYLQSRGVLDEDEVNHLLD